MSVIVDCVLANEIGLYVKRKKNSITDSVNYDTFVDSLQSHLGCKESTVCDKIYTLPDCKQANTCKQVDVILTSEPNIICSNVQIKLQ
jgi:hypothetical protein